MNNSVRKRIINVNELKKEPGATAVLKDFKDHTDPTYIGPGSWNILHRRAWMARTPATQYAFMEFMKDVCTHFPCVICRGHCSEYIRNHPMEDYLNLTVSLGNEKVGLGLFIWTWKFHNAVNARLQKPMMSWDTAYSLYSELQDSIGSNNEALVCSKKCLDSDNKNNLRIHRIINKR